MKKPIADKWIKALRSGAYHQGTGALCEEDPNGDCTFCCLGVLTELYVLDQHKQGNYSIVWEPVGSDGNLRVGYHYGILDTPIKEWAGLSSGMGIISKLSTTLVDLNDGDKKTFPEIADIIEEHYEEL